MITGQENTQYSTVMKIEHNLMFDATPLNILHYNKLYIEYKL